MLNKGMLIYKSTSRPVLPAIERDPASAELIRIIAYVSCAADRSRQELGNPSCCRYLFFVHEEGLRGTCCFINRRRFSR